MGAITSSECELIKACQTATLENDAEDVLRSNDSVQDMSTSNYSVSEASGVISMRKNVWRGKDKALFGAGNSADQEAGPGCSSLARHHKPREKDAATREVLRKAMKQDRVCGMFEDEEVDTLIETMKFYEFAAGEFICTQGEAGTTFFVNLLGKLEVSVDRNICNTLMPGSAFGSLALLYNCPRTASVKALEAAGVWGADAHDFHNVLVENCKRRIVENRKFIDTIKIFDGVTDKQKDKFAEALYHEVFEDKARVFTKGEKVTAIYFVTEGTVQQLSGGQVNLSGVLEGGVVDSTLGTAECFGERALLLDGRRHDNTVVSVGRSKLCCLSVETITEALGNDIGRVLEANFLLQSLRKSEFGGNLTFTQQYTLLKAMVTKTFDPGQKVEDDIVFLVIIEGSIIGTKTNAKVTYERGHWYEARENQEAPLTQIQSGAQGARMGVLTKECLLAALTELGINVHGSAEQAIDYTEKMLLAKKVPIWRHLSQEQTANLVKSFVFKEYKKGQRVITQGEVGNQFFVIAGGEVKVSLNGKHVRNMGRNMYFGERALLFDEPRTATVEVVTNTATFWMVDKQMFSQCVKGNMLQELMYKIRLQDTSVTLKDVKSVKVIGKGAAGVVRLVEHKTTKTRYALKRVKKQKSKIPAEVKRECELLADIDHPFIMKLVKTMEAEKSVYILTELITGGELHWAIRQIPTALSREQAQFYTGTLLLVLEDLAYRNIIFRDLKPENVMLDNQGYLKLIDFGIAKKLEDHKSRTFTMIGTPHYMAPEVIRGKGYGTEVDVWSLGVILFEFVCGYLPFGDDLEDASDVCTAVLKQPLVIPPRYRDEAGRELMQGLLVRQPKKRMGSGINGFEDVKKMDYFKMKTGGDLFDAIMGRELTAPVVPKKENYSSDGAADKLSDADDLG